jgi:hypothetical protein
MTAEKINISYEIELEGKPQTFYLAISDLLKSGKPIDLSVFKTERHCRIVNGGNNSLYDKITKILKRCDNCNVSLDIDLDADGLPTIKLINHSVHHKSPNRFFVVTFNEDEEIEQFDTTSQ